MPLFVVALLVVRGLSALVFRSELSGRETAAVGLLQATSLPFLVTASMIGVETGLISAVNAAALVAAGMISVLVFPAAALGLLRGRAGAVSGEMGAVPARQTGPGSPLRRS